MSTPRRNAQPACAQSRPPQQPHPGRQDLPPWAEHMKYMSQQEYDREMLLEQEDAWDQFFEQQEREKRGNW